MAKQNLCFIISFGLSTLHSINKTVLQKKSEDMVVLYWAKLCQNWHLKRTVTAQDWLEDCHKIITLPVIFPDQRLWNPDSCLPLNEIINLLEFRDSQHHKFKMEVCVGKQVIFLSYIIYMCYSWKKEAGEITNLTLY